MLMKYLILSISSLLFIVIPSYASVITITPHDPATQDNFADFYLDVYDDQSYIGVFAPGASLPTPPTNSYPYDICGAVLTNHATNMQNGDEWLGDTGLFSMTSGTWYDHACDYSQAGTWTMGWFNSGGDPVALYDVEWAGTGGGGPAEQTPLVGFGIATTTTGELQYVNILLLSILVVSGLGLLRLIFI